MFRLLASIINSAFARVVGATEIRSALSPIDRTGAAGSPHKRRRPRLIGSWFPKVALDNFGKHVQFSPYDPEGKVVKNGLWQPPLWQLSGAARDPAAAGSAAVGAVGAGVSVMAGWALATAGVPEPGSPSGSVPGLPQLPTARGRPVSRADR
jgi:hypothetical protein